MGLWFKNRNGRCLTEKNCKNADEERKSIGRKKSLDASRILLQLPLESIRGSIDSVRSTVWRRATLKSGNPDQLRVVGQAGVIGEIPVILISEAGGVTVKESEVGTCRMEIGVDVVLLGHASQFAIVEQPNGVGGFWDRRKFYLVSRTTGVDVLVQAVMKQIVTVAASWIGWANPDGPPDIRVRVCAPFHELITGLAKHAREVDVPTFIH